MSAFFQNTRTSWWVNIIGWSIVACSWVEPVKALVLRTHYLCLRAAVDGTSILVL